MTIIAISPTTFATVDLYRDIHKGIRAELFAITTAAGSIDPGSRIDRAALADHIVSVAAVLESHAHHEDVVIDPVLAVHLPALAEEITMDHERLESSFGRIVELPHRAAHQPFFAHDLSGCKIPSIQEGAGAEPQRDQEVGSIVSFAADGKRLLAGRIRQGAIARVRGEV